MIPLIIVASIVILFLIVWAGAILKDKKICQAVRDSAPSDFIRLSDGWLEYEFAGPEDGEPVILVSGFSIPFFVWDHIFPGLAAAGYRVLRYNHYGRGLSDHVKGDYNPELFERELAELVTVLGLKKPFTLCALSMGGAISVYHANRRPDQVKALALVSPAGFPLADNAVGSTKILGVPVVGDFIVAVFGDSVLGGKNISSLMTYEDHPEFQDKFVNYLKYRGRTAALLSTLRHMPINDMPSEYARLSKTLPVLLIWGREDAVIPFSNSDLVRKAVPQTVFHAIPDAGHNSQYERPELVLGYLLEFLKENG